MKKNVGCLWCCSLVFGVIITVYGGLLLLWYYVDIESLRTDEPVDTEDNVVGRNVSSPSPEYPDDNHYDDEEEEADKMRGIQTLAEFAYTVTRATTPNSGRRNNEEGVIDENELDDMEGGGETGRVGEVRRHFYRTTGRQRTGFHTHTLGTERQRIIGPELPVERLLPESQIPGWIPETPELKPQPGLGQDRLSPERLQTEPQPGLGRDSVPPASHEPRLEKVRQDSKETATASTDDNTTTTEEVITPQHCLDHLYEDYNNQEWEETFKEVCLPQGERHLVFGLLYTLLGTLLFIAVYEKVPWTTYFFLWFFTSTAIIHTVMAIVISVEELKCGGIVELVLAIIFFITAVVIVVIVILYNQEAEKDFLLNQEKLDMENVEIRSVIY